MRRIHFLLFPLIVFRLVGVSIPTMDLDEVQEGMIGSWDTVVKGDELRSFKLKVLGVSPSFIGPKKPVIICEAIDAEQILNGPVGGMSGSPVYIDGKLVGAYAYGYTWPKEQAIIGVTPINSMIDIVENFPPIDPEKRYRKSYNNGREGLFKRQASNLSAGTESLLSDFAINNVDAPEAQNPFPLMVSGISQSVLDAFAKESEEAGIEWVVAPTASSAPASDWTEQESVNFNPGMPIAGVLMGGDFSITGVGTVTWKEGNKILGFGHPFLGAGDVQIPMAPARVITIVRSVYRSFKLSNIGPVVGSIYQDRLTGIAGEIGREAPTIKVNYKVGDGNGKYESYDAEVFEHPSMSPLLSAIGLMQCLQTSLESNEEQTLYLKTKIKVRGQDSIQYKNVAVGSSGAMQLAFQLLGVMRALTDNPFEFPKIESLDCEVVMKPVQHFSFFDQITVESDVPAPAENLDVKLRIRNYLGEPVSHELSIPIPVGTKGEVLTMEIVDANSLGSNNMLIRPDMDTLSDIVRTANEIKSSQNIYVRLLKKAQGLLIQGDEMVDLPPSVTHLFSTPKNAQYSSNTTEVVLWDTVIQTEGVFFGSYRLNIEIK